MDVSPQAWVGLFMMVCGFAAFAVGLFMPTHKPWQQLLSELLFFGGLIVVFAGFITVTAGSPAQPPVPAKQPYWLPGPTL